MDMQGNPIGGENSSTKVTSGAQSQKSISEGAGPVASDSLAAESAKFGENRGSAPLSVSGSKSTFANTETSGATTLAPARDAATRDDAWNESGAGEKYPEGAGGQGQFPGSHAGGTYSGGSTAAKREFKEGGAGQGYDTTGSGGAFSDSAAVVPSADQISSGSSAEKKTTQTESTGGATQSSQASSGGDEGRKVESDVPTAPSYVTSVTQPLNEAKPKGEAVEGSEEDFKGPSNQGATIGSKDDPALAAEQTFQASESSGTGGSGPRQGQVTGNTAYDDLKGSEQA